MGKEQELLEAARTGNVVLVEKLLSGKRGILGTASGSIPLPNLLSMWRGLNVNCADSSGYTPLHHASLNGHRDVVLKLLQFEASTNVADSKGCFPLHLAAWRGDVDIVRILVHHGPSHCRVNQQNHERETALHCAAQYGHSEVVSILLKELTDPTMRNSRDETPLDLAALYGRLQVVCMLVTAHPNLMSSHGTRRHTPLHLAARNGHHSAVHTLLEAGMDVNSQTENGSALHEAALYGKMDVVRLLLDTGGCHEGVHVPPPYLCSCSYVYVNLSPVFTPLIPLSLFLCVCKPHMRGRSHRLVTVCNQSVGLCMCVGPGMCVWCTPTLTCVCFLSSDNGPYQQNPPPASSNTLPLPDDRRQSLVPVEFAGLLHGSSPACETPDTPYHLYTSNTNPKAPKHTPSDPHTSPVTTLGNHGNLASVTQPPELGIGLPPPLIIPHTGNEALNSQNASPSSSSPYGWNGEAVVVRGGVMRSIPRSVLDLKLSKSLSKSDSNLLAVSPIQVRSVVLFISRFNGETLSQPDCRCYRVDGYSLLKRLPLHPLIGPRCPMQSVGQWLDSIGLVQYENHLLANGFDNVQFMGSNVVEDQDLLEIGILNSAHRQRLLQAIRLLPRVRPIGYDGNNPTSVAEWLESLELGDYTKSFLINGYTSMELVRKIWEIELINVLKVSLIGHRKRILASLGDRLHQDPPQKPPRAISLRVSVSCPAPSPLLLSQSEIMPCSLPITTEAVRDHALLPPITTEAVRDHALLPPLLLSEWCEPITLRPPNEATSSTPVQYWQHHPEKLIFQSCDYEAYYLGSMLVKELRGTESTQDACSKMRKSTEQMKKVPTIVLSVSYKGVKFIDATNKNIIAEHEIRNISCAAQDPEDLSTFAYITKDLKSSHHYCHVFTAFDVNLAYEIILTLGQAFEVAYQLALQARKSGHGSSTLPESFDIKPNKPVPKPRVNIRKSVSNDTSLYSPFNLCPLLQPPPQPLTFRQHVCQAIPYCLDQL
uniref:Ankyrin repeat and sterile alpha motif domain containing 1B n=1 Tax=Salmo trutta TaxID=8032 RepID=A0A674D4Q2_SALTR